MSVRLSSIHSFLWLMMAMLCMGQSAPERDGAESASQVLKQAKAQWAKGYYDEAFELSRQARSLALEESDSLSFLTALRLSGKYYVRNGFLEEGEAVLDSVVARAQWIGPLHHEILLARGERADLEAWRGDFGECIALYQNLVKDCNSLPENDTLRPLVYQWIGQAYSYIEEYDSALSYCHKALDLFSSLHGPEKADVAYVENALGIMYSDIDQTEEAIRHLERAADILSRALRPGHSHVIQVRSNTAIQYQYLGLPWKALELYKTNLIYLDSLKPAVQHATLFNYASALIMVGDYHEALRYLDQSEALLKERPGLRADGLNRVYYARSAALQSLEQYEQALPYIQAAIDADLNVFGPDHSQLVLDYNRKGTIYSHMGKYPEAVQAIKKALSQAVRTLDPNSMRTGWIWESLGEAQTEMGNVREALQSFKQAEGIFKKGGMEWNLGGTYRFMATAWQHLEEPDSNLAYLYKAWKVIMPELPFQSAPDAQTYAYWMDTQLADLFEVQGKSMEWRYTQSQDPAELNAALACYEAFLAVTDSQRYYYEARESQQQQLRNQRSVVEKGLAICHALFLLHQDDAYLKRGFLMTEQHKANQLRDHLRSQKALHFSGIPDSLLEQEHYFRQRMAAADAANYEGEADSLKASKLRETRFGLHQEYKNLLKTLSQDHPRYFQLKYPAPLKIETLASQLTPLQALYSYFWGEKQLYIFQFFAGEWQMNKVPTDSSLTGPLRSWLAYISQPPGSSQAFAPIEMANQAFWLAQHLLPGLRADHRQLLIVPDGMLGYLPFESLLSAEVSHPEFRGWPFLARQHSMTYSYAADLLLKQSAQTPPLAAAYLGFAPDFGEGEASTERSGLKPLRFNREEVEKTAQLLDGKALTGIQARESIVKSLGADPLILHFATHALADEDQLMESRLYFGQEPDSIEDGILHAWEIYGLTLNSSLTVLSACQTGLGPLQGGEGVMSLARAFQYSGSRSVLASRWQTDDQSGARLTLSFFSGLSNDISATDALQQARQAWLESSDNYHCHPYFWSGYALIGEDGPVLIKRPVSWLSWWLAGGGLMISLIMIGYFFIKY